MATATKTHYVVRPNGERFGPYDEDTARELQAGIDREAAQQQLIRPPDRERPPGRFTNPVDDNAHYRRQHLMSLQQQLADAYWSAKASRDGQQIRVDKLRSQLSTEQNTLASCERTVAANKQNWDAFLLENPDTPR